MTKEINAWLSRDVFPLWIKQGVDWDRGGFVENFSAQGAVRKDPRRAMVRARQIYSFRTGIEMGVAPTERSRDAIVRATNALLKNYSNPSGSFKHTLDEDGRLIKSTPELYTQAFVLFALGHTFALTKEPGLKARAKELIAYLRRERRVAAGGFTEIGEKGVLLYQSNPHMHLFEAAVTWMEVDSDPEWRRLADEMVHLCVTRFIDPTLGLLAEFFNENWIPQRENGKFIFEPGHQYEWSWLLGRYEKVTGIDLKAIRKQLFERSEAYGVDPVRKVAIDQVWSDYRPKARTARFWPQTERIKAAAQLGMDGLVDRDRCAAVADDGMKALFRYLQTPAPGLWFDTMEEDGRIPPHLVKASSLYHIIGAMAEYVLFRKS